MPVLPLVGSTMTVSRSMRPSRSAASIIATPMRSFTDASGVKNSHLASTTAWSRGISRFSRTSGVPPIVSVMSLKIRPWGLMGMSFPMVDRARLFRLDLDDFLWLERAARIIQYPTRHINSLARSDRHDHITVERPRARAVELAGPRGVVRVAVVEADHDLPGVGRVALGAHQFERVDRKTVTALARIEGVLG